MSVRGYPLAINFKSVSWKSLLSNISVIIHEVDVDFSSPCRISQHLGGPGQTAEFIQSEKKLKWCIKKMYGRSEVFANFKVSLFILNMLNR